MKDVTEKVLGQSSEYGRLARLNVTRVDMYVSKTEHIFRIFQATEMDVRIEAGGMLVEKCRLQLANVRKKVRWYGEKFFMDIHYRAGGIIILELTGVAPETNDRECWDRLTVDC